jgi:photosystem II stability/assembly factor-like uncharacterized protein
MKKSFFTFILAFCLLNVMAQYPANWNVTGIGGGGSLFCPSINPGNSNEYYAACDMSELFHSTDFGQSYSIVNFQQMQSSDFTMVSFTNNANILYSINYANNETIPVKSTDGGVTWNALPGNPDATQETFGIWADYTNPNWLIIAYYGTVYFSNNGGTSFADIHDAVYNGAGVLVGGVFFNGNDIYIGTNDGLLESTNSGSNFNMLTTTGFGAGEQMASFAAATQNGAMRFFCITSDSNNIYSGLVGGDYWGFLTGVYSMDNNSGTWIPRMNGIDNSSDFLMYAGMAQNDTGTVYLGGGSSASVPDVMKSSNGGHSWTHVFNTTNNLNINTGWCGDGGDHGWSYPECLFGLSVAANNKDVAIFTDYSDVHKTSDGGTNWQQAYLSPSDQNPAGALTPTKHYYHSVGLENTSSWFLHWSDANNIFAASTDIYAIRSKDAGQSWAFDYTGPTTNTTYCIAKNISGSTIYAATSSVHDMYKSYRLEDAQLDSGTGLVIFSTDNGATWNTLHNFTKPVYWLATDPNNSDRMYAAVINHTQGLGGIWITNNLSSGASSTWIQLASPARTQGHPATMTVLNNGDLLCSFSGRRNAIGAFTDSSGVFLYNPTGSSWTDKSDPNEKYWCHDVVADPNDATQNTWYCGVYSGWGGNGNGMGGLYKTTNAGTNWTKILDNVDVSSCTFNPNNSNELFVTTMGYGLYYSSNINNTTPTFSLVSSYDFSAPERVFFNPYDNGKIWVTSFGHGMQWGDMTLTGIASENDSEASLSIYPNPFSECTSIDFSGLKGSSFTIEIYDMMGQLLRTINNINQAHYTLSRENIKSGIYILKILDKQNICAVKRIVIN